MLTPDESSESRLDELFATVRSTVVETVHGFSDRVRHRVEAEDRARGPRAADIVGSGLVELLNLDRVGRRRPDLLAPGLAARLVYYAVLIVAVTTALQHVGLRTDLVNTLIAIGAATGTASFGLAFALASRTAFRDVIARHYAQHLFRPGDRVMTADGTTGVIVGYDAVTVTLRVGPDRIVVPCRLLMEGAVTVKGAYPADQPADRPGTSAGGGLQNGE